MHKKFSLDINYLAARISDRGESLEQALSIPAGVVWADEFDSLWLRQEHVHTVQKGEKLFYVISPELHGFDHETRYKRWADFKSWGIDGICTDYPSEAKLFWKK